MAGGPRGVLHLTDSASAAAPARASAFWELIEGFVAETGEKRLLRWLTGVVLTL